MLSRSKENIRLKRFEEVVLPHLGSAYNLARWLTHNDQDAEDLVQETYLRAFKFFDGFRGEDGRAWLLTIVRNTFYSRLPQRKEQDLTVAFDEEAHGGSSEAYNPELLLLQNVDNLLLKQALEELPAEYREVVVLKELEGLSYKEIADLAGIPIGTVMSRLSRARKRLHNCLTRQLKGEIEDEL